MIAYISTIKDLSTNELFSYELLKSLQTNIVINKGTTLINFKSIKLGKCTTVVSS